MGVLCVFCLGCHCLLPPERQCRAGFGAPSEWVGWVGSMGVYMAFMLHVTNIHTIDKMAAHGVNDVQINRR